MRLGRTAPKVEDTGPEVMNTLDYFLLRYEAIIRRHLKNPIHLTMRYSKIGWALAPTTSIFSVMGKKGTNG